MIGPLIDIRSFTLALSLPPVCHEGVCSADQDQLQHRYTDGNSRTAMETRKA